MKTELQIIEEMQSECYSLLMKCNEIDRLDAVATILSGQGKEIHRRFKQ